MSETPAWAVERAREILALIDVEPSEWCPDCDGQGEIDDGKCGRCGKYGCRTKTCPSCNGGKMKPIDRVGIIASALTIPDGHVRLPRWDEALVAEIRSLRKALWNMRFAYLNKDADCPHEFEKAALEEAGRLIGNE